MEYERFFMLILKRKESIIKPPAEPIKLLDKSEKSGPKLEPPIDDQLRARRGRRRRRRFFFIKRANEKKKLFQRSHLQDCPNLASFYLVLPTSDHFHDHHLFIVKLFRFMESSLPYLFMI